SGEPRGGRAHHQRDHTRQGGQLPSRPGQAELTPGEGEEQADEQQQDPQTERVLFQEVQNRRRSQGREDEQGRRGGSDQVVASQHSRRYQDQEYQLALHRAPLPSLPIYESGSQLLTPRAGLGY